MTIDQINASYFLQEDRLLLRINTANREEFQFWLTRRVALFIAASLNHFVGQTDIAPKAPVASIDLVDEQAQKPPKINQ